MDKIKEDELAIDTETAFGLNKDYFNTGFLYNTVSGRSSGGKTQWIVSNEASLLNWMKSSKLQEPDRRLLLMKRK